MLVSDSRSERLDARSSLQGGAADRLSSLVVAEDILLFSARQSKCARALTPAELEEMLDLLMDDTVVCCFVRCSE